MELVTGKQLMKKKGLNEDVDLSKSIVNELSGEEDSPVKSGVQTPGMSTFTTRLNAMKLDNEKIEIKVK